MGWVFFSSRQSPINMKPISQLSGVKAQCKWGFWSVCLTSCLLALNGCALMSDKKADSSSNPVEAKNVPQDDVQANVNNPNQSLDALDLNAQTMFQIMAAELLVKRGQPKAAFEAYYPIAEQLRTPELAERTFQMAMVTYDIANIDKATQLWKTISPQSASVWKASYLLSLRQGKVEKALQEWQTYRQYSDLDLPADLIETATKVSATAAKEFGLPFMQALTSKYADEWIAFYSLGVVSTAYQNPEIGIEALQTAKQMMYKADSDTSESVIYSLLSKLYLSVTPPQKGVDALKPYVKKNPTDLLVQERLARIEVQAKLYEDAEKRYEYIIKNEPKAYSSQFALALLQMERKAYESSEKNLRAVLQNEGYQSIAYYYLGVLYQETDDYEKAKAHFLQVDSPSYLFDAQLHLAEIAYLQGNKKEAMDALATIKPQTNKNHIKLLRAKAIFAANENRLSKSIALYSQALQIEPDNVDLLKAQSLLLYNAKRYEEYESVLMKAIKIQPNDSSLLNALGYFYAEQNVKLDKAYELLTQALQIEPNSFYILDSMGWYYYQKGDFKTALEYLEKSFSLNQDVEVFLHLVKAYWANGEMQRAKQLWQKYQQNFDGNHQVQNIIKDLENTL